MIAGALLGQPVELVKCRTIDVEVPAQAEFVLEGEILAGVHEDEGPYGEYTGYSTDRSTRNVFVVKAITRRNKPIFHDIIPGYSAEHLLLGRVRQGSACRIMRLKEMVPTLKALNFPKSGTHFHAYMSLKKTAEGQPQHALMLLLGLDPYLKFVVAVDEDVNVFDEQEVLWAHGHPLPGRHRHVHGAARVLQPARSVVARRACRRSSRFDATAPLTWDVERASRCRPDAVACGQALLARN